MDDLADENGTGSVSSNESQLLRSKFSRIGKIINIVLMPLLIGAAVFMVVRDSQQLSTTVLALNPWLVLLSFIVECTGLLIAIPVWRQILHVHDMHFSLIDDIRIYCYSILGSAIPGRVWTILGRTALYRQIGGPSVPMVSASLMETLLTGAASMTLYAMITAFRPDISLWRNPTLSFVLTFLMLIMIHPGVFNTVTDRLHVRLYGKKPPRKHYTYRHLAIWAVFEGLVILIGGLAVFVLLASFTPVSLELLVPIIAAWAAGAAAGNLFFWLPGTPFLRDGAMVLALSPYLPLSLTIIFVVLVRIWTILSLLLLSSLIWLFVDRPNRPTPEKGFLNPDITNAGNKN